MRDHDQRVLRLDLEMSEIEFQRRKDFYAGVAGRTLMKHYPFANWLVDVRMSGSGGVLFIRLPDISTKFGMIVNLVDRVPALEEDVMHAGGELLERFKVKRGRGGDADIANLPRDLGGEVLGAEKGELDLQKQFKKNKEVSNGGPS